MTWLRCKLGDIAILEYGAPLPESARHKTGIVAVAGSNGVVGFHNEALVRGPGIVVGRKGSAGTVTWFESDFWPIDTTFYVVPKIPCDLRWLYHLLKFTRLHRLSIVTGVPGLNRNDAYGLSVELPSPSEQRCIARILDQADKLRRQRAEADALPERIMPALFAKLFGDPVTNVRNWSIFSLSEFFTQDRHGPRCGPFGTALKKHEYVARGIPVWGIDNVLPNRFLETGSLFVTEEKFQELTSYAVQVGDVLISRAGTVGRMCVARPSVSRSIIGTNLIRLAFDTGALEPEYFSAMFTYFPQISLRFRAVSDEGAYSFMNTSVLKSLQIPVPPIALQRVFATHTCKMRELVEKQESSRCQIRSLFDTLIRRAFSGVLSAKWREAHMRELVAEMEQQSKLLGDASARDLTFV